MKDNIDTKPERRTAESLVDTLTPPKHDRNENDDEDDKDDKIGCSQSEPLCERRKLSEEG